MPSNEEIVRSVIDAFESKLAVRPLRCPLCQATDWYLPSNYTSMAVGKNPNEIKIGGPYFPLAPLVCKNCGNTHLLNLKVLGFEDTSTLALKEEDDEDDGK